MPVTKVYQCCHCRRWVDPRLADRPPAAHQGRTGTATDPKAPGDHKDCCEACCYGTERCKKQRSDP